MIGFNVLSVLFFDIYSSRACTGHKSRYSSNLGEKNSFIGFLCLHCLDSDVGRKANPSGDDLWCEISSFDRSTDLDGRDNARSMTVFSVTDLGEESWCSFSLKSRLGP